MAGLTWPALNANAMCARACPYAWLAACLPASQKQFTLLPPLQSSTAMTCTW